MLVARMRGWCILNARCDVDRDAARRSLPEPATRRQLGSAFAAMFVTVAGFLSPITQLPWKIAPSSMISAGVSMSL